MAASDRRNGRVVKSGGDLVSATRYAIMMSVIGPKRTCRVAAHMSAFG